MICPGIVIDSNGRIPAEVAANPTPAKYGVGGWPLSADDKLVVATGAVSADDTYLNGFRRSPNGAIRGTATASNNFESQGYTFTETGRLYISNGSSNPAHYANGQGFSTTGRLILDY